ncbi:peptidase inhibitor family I36 protein [Streptomyces sp. 6-11-2]|uniref:peptidase inhibitor family I36 protein n=1 Tax=Streptomyces sp. 6-11-2 TaxID=2585753 RepID=UPI001143C8AF|nr:peptidase inhibitor family I36 protein [Streptomyces sp. 6-11-2]GED83199.1 hypothetical protein TNCT6_02840 [Streptomyces sp. 6-11-2]
MRAAAASASAFPALSAPASAADGAGLARAGIDCPSGCGCIYPEINFGGQPWAQRAVDGGVKDRPSAIRDRGSSIRNNSDRAPRVWEKRNCSGRWVPPAAETSSSAHEGPAVVPPHAGQGPLTNWRHRASRRTD